MILFSPLGMTDPIRDFFDGACLHIIRHYKPRKVFLFYTAEVRKMEEDYHPYTRAIRALSPEIEIAKEFTDITDPQHYDEFINIFPEIIYKLHEESPNEEILLNLSSGTPQMKNLLAIIACDSSWTRAIQVNSPARKSGKGLLYISNESDFKTMLEENLDNEPDAENRCIEPELRVIRKYSDKAKILSLIEQYEYDAALTIAKQNPNISDDVKNLLKHAALRLKLRTTEAKKVFSKYNGNNLFPFSGIQEKIMEYLLTIQADRKVGNLSSVLIKTVPFLYEFLAEYILRDKKLKIRKSCIECKKKDSPFLETNFELKRDRLKENNPELLNFLDLKFHAYYQDKFLSEKVLKFICEFAANNSEDKFYTEIWAKLQDIEDRNVIVLRNEVAHIITDVDEEKFKAVTGMTSNELVNYFFDMLAMLYVEENSKIKNQRKLYNSINDWIKNAMEN